MDYSVRLSIKIDGVMQEVELKEGVDIRDWGEPLCFRVRRFPYAIPKPINSFAVPILR